MPAPLGNKNAIGNKGGAPPIYDAYNPEDIKTVEELCVSFFQYIQGETRTITIPPEKEGGEPTYEEEWIRKPEPPTVTGLTLYLGFEAKSTLYEYAKKVEFSNPIKKALTKIEQYHEIAASHGEKCVGNIFILKNFGWRDSVDHTTNGKDLPAQNNLSLDASAVKEIAKALNDKY